MFAIKFRIVDKCTRLFYGSAFVEMESINAATAAVGKGQSVAAATSTGDGSKGGRIDMTFGINNGPISIGKRRLKVVFASLKEGEEWPPADYRESERPVVPA